MATIMPTSASAEATADRSEDTRVYECAVLYPYPIHQKEEQELLKAVEGLFDEAGGKLVLKDAWGRRGLAYTIGGYEEGNYVIYYYELDPSKIKEIDNQLKILKGVLRHLIVKPPKHYHIISYADQYVKWQEDEKLAGERIAREKEEKLKKQVLDKAKRQSKVIEKKKPDAAPSDKPRADIGKELDKLISDADLGI